jgi:tripartite-type tricarboxylate transporter receptor subunit TctC
MDSFKAKITARICAGVLLISMAMIALPGSATAADSGWQPRHPVNLIIMAGKGGGADKLARLWQGIIAKHHLRPQPFIPINKPGGSGAEALMYMSRKKRGAYDILVTLDSLYTTPIRLPQLGLKPTSLTAIRLMANDTFLLWINPSAHPNIKNVKDFVKAVKAAHGNWKMGGTGSGQEDSLVTAMLADAYGLDSDMKYVPYKGGGLVAEQLIGGHIDSTVNNPSEQLGFFQAGKSKPLAAFTEKPLAMFPKAPTFKSLGKPDLVYVMDRMVLGPPDMPSDARQWYINLFQKISQTKEWKNYVKKNSLIPTTLHGDEMTKYLKKRYKLHQKLMPLWQKFKKQ